MLLRISLFGCVWTLLIFMGSLKDKMISPVAEEGLIYQVASASLSEYDI